MRIIAGERRGHKLEGPLGRDLRPTSDMVREAIFNIVRDRIEDTLVLDLFAGTGALGLEALSRGAARAVFVERSREHLAAVRRNIAHLRYEDRTTIVTADAYRWINGFPAEDATPILALLDPPYQDYEGRNRKRLTTLIERLLERLTEGSTIVIESGRRLDPVMLPDPAEWDQRRYGGTTLAVRRFDPRPTPEDEPENDPTVNDRPIEPRESPAE